MSELAVAVWRHMATWIWAGAGSGGDLFSWRHQAITWTVLIYYDPGCPLAFRCEWLEKKKTLFVNSFSYVVMKSVFLKNRGLVTSMGGTEL